MPLDYAQYESGMLYHSAEDVTGRTNCAVAARPLAVPTKVFDCGHGRLLTLVIPRPDVVFVTLEDAYRNHPLLCWRDSPKITLTLEDLVLVHTAKRVFSGSVPPAELALMLSHRCPKVSESEWRRSLVRDFFEVAVPYDPERAVREAMGIE